MSSLKRRRQLLNTREDVDKPGEKVIEDKDDSKVLWKNASFNQDLQSGSTPSIPFPFVSIDVDEMNINRSESQAQRSTAREDVISSDKDSELLQERLEKSDEEDRLFMKSHDKSITKTGFDASSPLRASSTDGLFQRIDIASPSPSAVSRTLLQKLNTVLGEVDTKPKSLSPLNSWYLLGGRPDFRPAASRKKPRLMMSERFELETTWNDSRSQELTRIKIKNEIVLEDMRKNMESIKSEDLHFEHYLRKCLLNAANQETSEKESQA